jgi:antirestriction protein ArdC
MSKAYEVITDRIASMLSGGKIPWRRPWNALRAAGSLRPRNAVSGSLYRGANWFLLGLLPYQHPVFLTFKQALALGGSVRKGEHGFPVIFWKLLEVTEENAADADAVGRRVPLLRTYTVFNIEQCDGLNLVLPEAPAAPVEFDPVAEAEAIWDGMPSRPELRYGGDRACYIPGLDQIRMPIRSAFPTAEGFYETLFHEAGHSSGAASRLNRKEIVSGSYFGARDYSLEELVAELCAAFLCAEAGVDQPVLENQAAYIQGWLSKLQAEPQAFVTAAARAQKAADFILRRGTIEKPEEAA